ncbi:MAG TPA: outer membrane lipoprotein carrier protein LolA, partial [Rhizomicrobium sp.]
MNFRLFRCLAIVAASGLVASSASVSLAQSVALSEAERSDLARISQAMNAIRSMEGNFVQIGPEGQIEQGRFYIDKPGRMRFEYASPSSTL